MKAIVITDPKTKLPIAIFEVKDFLDQNELKIMRKDCEANAKAKAERELEERKALERRVESLEKKADPLTKAIRLVLGFGGDLDEVEKELTGGESNG